MALVVAAVAAWACNSGEPGIGDCDGASVGDHCTLDNKAGVCIHDCESVLLCITDGRNENYDGICQESPDECSEAQEYDSCIVGKCVKVTDGSLECASECTGAGYMCDTGSCYLMGPADGVILCRPPGTKAVGDTCGTATDCVAGAQCLEMKGGSNCYQVCWDQAECDPAVCTDTELGFKVCVAPEGP